MSRDRIITTELESLEPWELTHENLRRYSKAELVLYTRDFLGGSWSAIRAKTKEQLIEEIHQRLF